MPLPFECQAHRDTYNKTMIQLSRARTREEAASCILDMLLTVDGVTLGGVYYIDRNEKKIRLIAERNLDSTFETTVREYEMDKDSWNVNTMLNGMPWYGTYSDISNDLQSEITGSLGAVGIIPIMYRGAVVACLNVASRDVAEYPEHIQSFIERCAAVLGSVFWRMEDSSSNEEYEQMVHDLFNMETNMLFVADSAGKVLYAGANAQRRLGYRPEQLVGMNLIQLHPPEVHEDAKEVLSTVFERGLGLCPLPLITSQGELIPVYTRIYILDIYGKKTLVGISVDSSLQSVEGKYVDKSIDLFSAITKISQAISQPHEQVDVPDILASLGTAVAADRVHLFLIDDEGAIRIVDSWQTPSIPTPRGVTIPDKLPYNAWWFGKFQERGHIVFDDASLLPDDAGEIRDMVMSLGVRSFLAVPIRIGTDIIGFISVDQVVSRRFWHHDEVRILTIAASLFSEYVQRGSIKSMLESSTIKLDNTLSSVEAVVSSLFHEIQTPLVTLSSYGLEWEKALEAGDAETVSEYCKVMLKAASRLSKAAKDIGGNIRASLPEEKG